MRGISRQSLAGRSGAGWTSSPPTPRADELRRLAGELFAVVHLLAGEPRLRRIVTDPAVGADQRAELLDGLLGDRVSASAAAVVEVLVRVALVAAARTSSTPPTTSRPRRCSPPRSGTTPSTRSRTSCSGSAGSSSASPRSGRP